MFIYNTKNLGHKSKVSVLKVPRHHEDVSIAQLSTTPWRRMGHWRYSSTHS